MSDWNNQENYCFHYIKVLDILFQTYFFIGTQEYEKGAGLPMLQELFQWAVWILQEDGGNCRVRYIIP